MRFLGSTNPQSNAGLVSGLRIAMETDAMTRTAPQDGHYFIGKGKFLINAGDPLPDGAAFVQASADNTRQERVSADGFDLAALREQHFAEFHAELVANATEISGTEQTFDFDVAGAYDRYIADERANGPDDALAFQDAVLGVFGFTLDACADCDDGDGANQEVGSVNDDEPKHDAPEPKPEPRAKKAAPENKAKAAPENR